MSKKTVSMSARPEAKVQPQPKLDHWIDGEEAKTSSLKPVRLTFDLDRTLHGRLRRHCFDREEHVSDFVRNLISESLPE